MKELVIALLGEYTPVLIDGEPIYSISALDFEWLIGAELFCLCVYCVFRILGVFINGK